MPEYKRQWVVELKRKGLYKEPSRDSLNLQDLETRLKNEKNLDQKVKLLQKKDSVLLRLKKQVKK